MISTIKKRKDKHSLHTLTFLRCHSLSKQKSRGRRAPELPCVSQGDAVAALRKLISWEHLPAASGLCNPGSGWLFHTGWRWGGSSEQTHPACGRGVGSCPGTTGHSPAEIGGGWESSRWEWEVCSFFIFCWLKNGIYTNKIFLCNLVSACANVDCRSETWNFFTSLIG